MYLSPTYDLLAAGSLASATLCAQRVEEPESGPAPEFAGVPGGSVQAAPTVTRKCGWRRLVAALLSPISGPMLCPQRSGASHI